MILIKQGCLNIDLTSQRETGGGNNPLVQRCRSSSRVTRASRALTRSTPPYVTERVEDSFTMATTGDWATAGDQYCAYRATEPERQRARLTSASSETACQHSSSIRLAAAVWGHHSLGRQVPSSCVPPYIQTACCLTGLKAQP